MNICRWSMTKASEVSMDYTIMYESIEVIFKKINLIKFINNFFKLFYYFHKIFL